MNGCAIGKLTDVARQPGAELVEPWRHELEVRAVLEPGILADLLVVEDPQMWDYARNEGFAIVSKDTDFRERSHVEGAPPKIVWLDVGNAGTETIERAAPS